MRSTAHSFHCLSSSMLEEWRKVKRRETLFGERLSTSHQTRLDEIIPQRCDQNYWRVRGPATKPGDCTARVHCKAYIAKSAPQRLHREDCIAEPATPRLHRKSASQRVHCKDCIAIIPATRPSEWSRDEVYCQPERALEQRHAIAATLIGRCSTVLRNRHHGHAKKASFGSSGKATHAMLTSQASGDAQEDNARPHRSATRTMTPIFKEARSTRRTDNASASSSAASQAIDLVRGDCKVAALTTVSCVDPVRGDSKTETYNQKLTTLLFLRQVRSF
jgi:hypothetical protein